MTLKTRLDRLERTAPLARCPQCGTVFLTDAHSATETPEEVLADIERKLRLKASGSGEKAAKPGEPQ